MADCKRKTANLFDKNNTTVYNAYIGNNSYWLLNADSRSIKILCNPNTTYTLSINTPNNAVFGIYETDNENAEPTSSETVLLTEIIRGTTNQSYSFTTLATTKAIVFQGSAAYVADWTNTLMLNTGSSPLPYEPYGWVHSLRKLGTATDTITTLPADLYADGNNATVGLVGNMSQIGTPTPTTPITPSETGERTNNLCPMIFSHTGVVDDNGGVTTQNTRLWTEMIPVSASSNYYVTINGVASNDEVLRFNRAIQYDASGTFISRINTGANTTATFTTAANCAYIVLDIRTMSLAVNINDTDVNTIQMNAGSTPLPYEPYGYVLPIKSANTTTPVYLGQVESTRKIKKYEVTGNETFTKNDSDSTHYLYYISRETLLPNSISKTPILCNELPVTDSAPQSQVGISSNNNFNVVYLNFGADVMNAQPSGNTAEGLKEYIAAQYSAGTPVCVWYVLATPQTAVVNEPIRKIGDYADTVSGITIPTITGKDSFDVQTTLKPSEVELTYTGWHDATVKEWDGSEWQ